jgi:hypothetical protein
MMLLPPQEVNPAQNHHRFACSPVRPDVKIAQLLEGIDAEHCTLNLAELWSLPIGEESLETVAGEI